MKVREEMARAHFRLGDIDRILGPNGRHTRIWAAIADLRLLFERESCQFQLSPGAGQCL